MLFNTDISQVPFYPSPQGGGDFRLTDTESWTNANRGRSVVVVRIAVAADNGKESSVQMEEKGLSSEQAQIEAFYANQRK